MLNSKIISKEAYEQYTKDFIKEIKAAESTMSSSVDIGVLFVNQLESSSPVKSLTLISTILFIALRSSCGICDKSTGIILPGTVAANAIAIVGSNPVSGMTLMTLIVASMVLVSVGLEGTSGMVASMVIGGVVCTALSMAGGFITDLKIGYWIGVTPAKQETWKFLGTLVSAATVGGVMIILNKTYGFVGENALVAPQANAMAAVIEPLMSGQGAPWMLYFAGAALALILNFMGVPVLAFALGMFIPLELNTPLLIGGFIAWLVSRQRAKDGQKAEQLAQARSEKGTLIASGFIAGGALMGVVSAVVKFCGVECYLTDWAASSNAALVGILAYVALIVYFIFASKKTK